MERRNRGRGTRGPGAQFSGMAGSGRQTDFPLRILVQSDMVGAIIGRQGSTIRQITQQTRASMLRPLALNLKPILCGAGVGASQPTKVSFRVDKKKWITETVDGASYWTGLAEKSINDINSFNLERIITVKGSIENMSKSEALISAKLRQSYENDLQAMAPQSMMFPGLHPMAMMATSNIGYTSRGSGFPGGLYGSGPAPYPSMYQSALPSQPGGQPGGDGLTGFATRHYQKIQGRSNTWSLGYILYSFSFQAQYLIFEKMREEGFVAGTDDVRLTVEILVPSSQVGRIIGKGGQNVRELQRVTGSIIKLPEQGSALPQEEETTVHIIGPFFSVQVSLHNGALERWCSKLNHCLQGAEEQERGPAENPRNNRTPPTMQSKP
uniref:K Homology domain-containing protein n=1 Tax=Timema monikensis TaxID=170555 RepID=A0A7R9HM59_9NEOP|nr:unnamed protein product [Timema monikensis]